MAARDPDSTDNTPPRSSTGDDRVEMSEEQRATRVDVLVGEDESVAPFDETERSAKDAVLSTLEREAIKRSERSDLVFPKEADTLTAHGSLPVRRDTMPIPSSAAAAPSGRARPPVMVPPPPPPIRPSPRAMLAAPPVIDLLEDDDLLDDSDDDTQTQAEPFKATEDPTSPTLSLEHRSDHAREVYRLFLASEYAPALELANELIAQGDDDPMLVTIARECRSSLASPSSAPPPPPKPSLFADSRVNGQMTLEELTVMTGMSLEQVLGLLERFVSIGVLTLSRPPSR